MKPTNDWSGFVKRDRIDDGGADDVYARMTTGVWVVYPGDEDHVDFDQRNFTSLVKRVSSLFGEDESQRIMVDVLKLTLEQEIIMPPGDLTSREWKVRRVA